MTRETKRTTAVTTLVLGLAAAAWSLGAAPQPEGRHRGDRDGGRRGGPGAVFRELDLSEDQRTQIRSLMEQGLARESHERVAAGREALNDAVTSRADEGTLRQLAYDLGQAEGDAAVERSRIHAQMMEILTPEQRAQYETLMAEREQRRNERRQRFEERRNHRRERNPDSF